MTTRTALAAPVYEAAVLLFGAAGPAPAKAAASPCHGWVLYLNKRDGVVRSTYSIYCDRKVDKIVLKAFMREGDRWSAMNTVTCRNTNICNNRESLRDRRGTQSYFVRAYEGDWPRPRMSRTMATPGVAMRVATPASGAAGRARSSEDTPGAQRPRRRGRPSGPTHLAVPRSAA